MHFQWQCNSLSDVTEATEFEARMTSKSGIYSAQYDMISLIIFKPTVCNVERLARRRILELVSREGSSW